MPSSKLPTSMRRLKAQLQLLKRPTVWGSAAVLLVAILFLAEYWRQPGQFWASQNEDPVPPEDTLRPRVNAPDANSFDSFGNLPELSSPSALNPTIPLLPSNPSSNKTKSTTPPATPTTPQVDGSNPFAVSGESADRLNHSADFGIPNLMNPAGIPITFAGSQPENTERTANSATTTDTSRSTSSSSGVSPLQSGLDRAATSSSTSTGSPNATNSATAEGTQSQSVPTTGASVVPTSVVPTTALGTQPLAPQPIPGQPTSVQTYPQQFYPQTSPPPGTTGYSMPPAFRTQSNTPSFGSPVANPSIAPSSSTGSSTAPTPNYSGYTASPQTQAAPFSIPRTTPGRSIGGGQINTFSNP